jgi:phosphoribosylamine---glycine ligase
VIERYTRDEIGSIWTDRRRMETWLAVELAATDAWAAEGVEITHAGTARRDGEVVTAGGRVLNVTGLGPTPEDARRRAYDAARRIEFEGMQMRTDIAARAVERVGAG